MEKLGEMKTDSALLECAKEECATAAILRCAHMRWHSGDVRGGVALAESALDVDCARCAGSCTVYAGMLLALFLASLRQIEAAREVQRKLVGSAEVRGDRALEASTTLVAAKVALAAGDYAGAAMLAERGLRVATESGLTAWTPLGNLVLAVTSLRRGDLSAALHHADRLEEDAVFGREMFPIGQATWAIVQIAEAGRSRAEAAALTRELLGSEDSIRWLMLSEPGAVPWLVRLMISLGERARARVGVRFAQRLAAENADVSSVCAPALHATALLEEDLGVLRRAADLHTDRWARASALEDIGVLLCRAGGEVAAAAEHFEQAMRDFAEIGSLRDSSRVMSRLRGINASPTFRERVRPRSGIPCLTDTEYAVAKLVSRGLTNSQTAEQMFVSRHTVAFHLRKVFQKIGVKSRLELAVMWSELDSKAVGG